MADTVSLKEKIKQKAEEFKKSPDFSFAVKYTIMFLLVVMFATFSMFFTPWTVQDLSKFPVILCNIVPRTITLLILVAPAFALPRKKAWFAGALTVWTVWLMIASSVSVGWIISAGIIGTLTATACFFWDRKKEENKRYLRFTQRIVNWFYVYVILTAVVEIIHKLNVKMPFFNIGSAFMSFLKTPDYFANNLMVILACSLFVFVIPKRKLAFSVCSAFWIIISIVSLIKYNNVYEPLLLLDLFEVPDAIAAIQKYFSFAIFVFAFLALVAVVTVIVLFAKFEKSSPFRWRNAIAAILIFLTLVTAYTGITRLGYTNSENKYVRATYLKNGFAYSVFTYALNSFVEKPEGYSENAIEEINRTIKTDYGKEKKKTPSEVNVTDKDGNCQVQNIIAVQLESFCDPYLFKAAFPDMEFERDPMPFIRALIENNTSGTVDVPVFGGQTVKSEFEFLTGLDLDLLPNGYNPFVTQINENSVDSIARRMKEMGYNTSAIHSYQGEFFDRNKVYGNMGFDRFISYEFMPEVEKRTGSIWANDEILVSQINEVLDSTPGKDFVFTVTVQLHGAYNPYDGEYPIRIDNVDDETLASRLEYYLSELEAFDKAIEHLIASLEARNEQTFVIFYSDHLPSLFYNVEEMSDDMKFTTQFFTWSNMGISKQTSCRFSKTNDIELFQLSTVLADILGYDGSYTNKFHTVYHSSDSYLKALNTVEYRLLFDDVNKDEYKNDNYQMGLHPIIITDIERVDPADISSKNGSDDSQGNAGVKPGESSASKPSSDVNFADNTPSEDISDSSYSKPYYVIKGQNLTDNVVIVINGKIYNLDYIDKETAILSDYSDELTAKDVISLRVIGEKYGAVLYESEIFEMK